MAEVITNCAITQTDSTILNYWIDDTKSDEYKKHGGYHSGVDIEATDVYALCSCVCTYVGEDEYDQKVVIVQYDANTSFRYANLSRVDVVGGQIITYEDQIGVADEFVHFELLTREESQWIVRVGKETYYKHDPISYVRGEYEFENEPETMVWNDVSPYLDDKVELGELIRVIKDEEDGTQTTIHFFSSVGKTTSFEKKFGMELNPREVAYINVPYNYKYGTLTAEDLIGYLGILIDDSNGVYSYLVLGDIDYKTTSWGYVSASVGEDFGYSNEVIYSTKRITNQYRLYIDHINLPEWGNDE